MLESLQILLLVLSQLSRRFFRLIDTSMSCGWSSAGAEFFSFYSPSWRMITMGLFRGLEKWVKWVLPSLLQIGFSPSDVLGKEIYSLGVQRLGFILRSPFFPFCTTSVYSWSGWLPDTGAGVVVLVADPSLVGSLELSFDSALVFWRQDLAKWSIYLQCQQYVFLASTTTIISRSLYVMVSGIAWKFSRFKHILIA